MGDPRAARGHLLPRKVSQTAEKPTSPAACTIDGYVHLDTARAVYFVTPLFGRRGRALLVAPDVLALRHAPDHLGLASSFGRRRALNRRSPAVRLVRPPLRPYRPGHPGPLGPHAVPCRCRPVPPRAQPDDQRRRPDAARPGRLLGFPAPNALGRPLHPPQPPLLHPLRRTRPRAPLRRR